MASALLNASQQMGGSLGLAILTVVASASFTRPAHPTPATLATATTNSWAMACAVSAGLLLAAVATGVLVRVNPTVTPPAAPASK